MAKRKRRRKRVKHTNVYAYKKKGGGKLKYAGSITKYGSKRSRRKKFSYRLFR